MDYRYETKDEARVFHKRRTAFIVIEDKLYYIKNSEQTHWEFCQKRGVSKEQFNKMTRGYYIDGNIVFYKGNFTYDEELIKDGLKYIMKIKEDCKLGKMKIYFGLRIPEKDEPWEYNYYYGKITADNQIIKNKTNY